MIVTEGTKIKKVKEIVITDKISIPLFVKVDNGLLESSVFSKEVTDNE